MTYEGLVEDPNLTGEIHMSDIPKNIKKLALSRDFKPTIRIGKSGITENLMSEITDQLSTKSLVKIKINKGLFEKSALRDVWHHLETSTNSKLVSSRGNVGVLWKELGHTVGETGRGSSSCRHNLWRYG